MNDRRCFLASVAALILSLTMSLSKTSAQDNVVYVALDGLRWQEVFTGAEERFISPDAGVKNVAGLRDHFWRETPEARRETLMPFLWQTIAKEGQLFGDPTRGCVARLTNGLKFSYPGYNEMFAGLADPRIDSNNKVPNPNINVLEFLNTRDRFKGRVAALTTWDVFPFILNQERSGLFVHSGVGPIVDEPLTPRQKDLNHAISNALVLWEGNSIDVFTVELTREYLLKHRPRALFLGLGETDEWGHGRRYDLYLHAAQKSDRQIKELWELLQSLPEYKDKTSLIISTDHGRGETLGDWTNHGKDVVGAEFVWMAVMGPRTPALGVREHVEVTQSQIAATIAQLVGEDFRAAVPQAAEPLPGVWAE
ncbi:MAG: alkaline phosphatase family protein [Planctomycetaceae bacterium]